MNGRWWFASLLSTVVILVGAQCFGETLPLEEPRLGKSRALVAEFSGRLQNALGRAMSDGGVESAITVCRDLAPQIASELSRQSGASVSRTSRKFRNPANAPEYWQEVVLEYFDRLDADGEVYTDEHFEQGSNGFHYMKAIRMNGVCLSCHGTALDPSVESLLDREYPHDRARGYQMGELRGAFSISWPVPEAKNP